MSSILSRWLKRKAPSQASYFNRAPRVTMEALARVSFEMNEPDGEIRVIRLANLSTTGVGFVRQDRAEWPTPGESVTGKLIIGDTPFDVEMTLVHVSPAVAGCRFLDGGISVADAIQRYFSLEIEAIRLSRVNPEVLKREDDGTPHWYLGTSNCEIYYIEAEGEILRFNLTFMGNYLEGGRDTPLRFGYLVDERAEQKPAYKGATLVRWQSRAGSPHLLGAAVKFVESAEGVPPAHRESLRDFILGENEASR